MKTVHLFLLILLMLALAAPAAMAGTGFGLAAGAHDGDFGAQLRKDFWLGGEISQITGQASAFFHNKTTFKADADYHFVINSGKPSRFYPLVGVQFGFNSDTAEFGLNLGGGAKFMLTETTAAFVEPKFVVGDWDGFCIMGGIYF